MKNSMMKTILVMAGLMGALQAHAIEGKWLAGFGIEPGGDRLITVQTNNGSSSTRANQGLSLNIGGVFPNNAEKTLETAVTIGFKFGGTVAKNGEALWTSVPIDLVQFYRADDVRFGLGGTFHVSNQVKVDIPGLQTTANLDDAFGLIVQVGWAPKSANYSLDLRYTSIKYTRSGFSGNLEGSTAGVFGTVRF